MQTTTFHCPSCAAALRWDGEKLKCDACGNAFKPEDVEAYAEAAAENAKPSVMNWEQFEQSQRFTANEGETLREFNCPACGASVMTDQNTAATSCVYCGNPTLIPERFEGGLRPDATIPFTVQRGEAENKLRAFFTGKKLLPDDFVRNCRVEDVTGLYVPYFLFDCQADARATYRATRVSVHRQGDWEVTKTQHYYVERAGDVSFEKVPVDASDRIDNVLTEAVEPFDYNGVKEFEAAYLAGYQADRYDKPATECAPRANERVETATTDAFRDTVNGYATVLPESTRINLKQGAVRYALLPVWLLTVRYGGQAFPFAVNGQTGKLVGELPVDKGKYRRLKWGLIGGITLAGALLVALLGGLGGL